MGFFGKTVNMLRKSLGYDTVADQMERQINKMDKREEGNLLNSKTNLENNKNILKYQTISDRYNSNIMNEILTNIEKLENLALEEVKKSTSPVKTTVDYFEGNYNSLLIWLNTIRKNISTEMFIKYEQQIEASLQKLKEKYLNMLLQNFEINSESLEEEEIKQLYQMIIIDLNALNISSPTIPSYKFLLDVKELCEKEKLILDNELLKRKLEERQYDICQEQINYNLEKIQRKREEMFVSKDYLEANKDRNRMKRG